MFTKSSVLSVLSLVCVTPVTALGAVIFAEPHITSGPGGGMIYLGVNTDAPGGEMLSYEYTGMSFTGVDPDVVVTPLPSSGHIEAPEIPDLPLAILVGSYEVLGSADPLDATTFEFNISFAPLAESGSHFDSTAHCPVEGSVTAVPEPSGLALLGFVAAACLPGRRKRRLP